jgi:hypothetical protein
MQPSTGTVPTSAPCVRAMNAINWRSSGSEELSPFSELWSQGGCISRGAQQPSQCLSVSFFNE